MLNTIIAIIVIVIMLAYCYRMFNLMYRTKSWFTEAIIVALCLLALTLINPDTAINANAIDNAYKQGFNDAIITADLIEVTEDSYSIGFGYDIPEVHTYTHD